MSAKRAYISGCRELKEGIPIRTDEGWEGVVRILLSVDALVVDGECMHPDASLVAFLARLMDREVYWIGRRPRGLLAGLVTRGLD